MPRDTFYYPSAGEDTYFAELETVLSCWPHGMRHYLDLFPVYASRRAFIRLLAHYELFKLTIDLPGHYADFGVYHGKSFFTWHKLLEVLAPTATHKKVIGFDTFSGFEELAVQDGDGNPHVQKHAGGLSAADFVEEFVALLALHNADSVLPANRGTIVQGDICETLPQWLDAHAEARFCLVNIDVDLYEPTAAILQHCWDRLVEGGVLILDEYGTSQWPGETRAWDHFAQERGVRNPLRRFSWANAPSAYVIKQSTP